MGGWWGAQNTLGKSHTTLLLPASLLNFGDWKISIFDTLPVTDGLLRASQRKMTGEFCFPSYLPCMTAVLSH